jgi:hypothetical protein
MNTATPTQRLILDAAIDGSVIHGTLTTPFGDRRDFHGWLELNTALEATLDPRAERAPSDNLAASAALPANARKNAAGILVPVGTFNDALSVTLWPGLPVTQYRKLTVTQLRADGHPASSGRRVLTGTIRRSR